jgi:hypothetical protein
MRRAQGDNAVTALQVADYLHYATADGKFRKRKCEFIKWLRQQGWDLLPQPTTYKLVRTRR